MHGCHSKLANACKYMMIKFTFHIIADGINNVLVSELLREQIQPHFNQTSSLISIFRHLCLHLSGNKKSPFYQARIWILWAQQHTGWYIYINIFLPLEQLYLSFFCWLWIADDWCVVAEAVLMLRFPLLPAQTLLFVPLLNEPKVNACRIQSGCEISWD